MLEDKALSHLMRLPHPGIGPKPDANRQPREWPKPQEPTLDSSCSNLYESVMWWQKVHRGTDHNPHKADGSCFGDHPHNIVLSLNLDGFQPYDRGGYSMTPMTLMVLNLPEKLRHKFEMLILDAVIPGRNAPKNYNTYLRVLVDELSSLQRDGFSMRDPYTGLPVTVRVKLLFTVADYPAHSSMNCQKQHGAYYGCHKCDIRGVHQGSCMGYRNFEDLAEGGTPPPLLTQQIYIDRARRFEQLTELRQAKKITDKEFKTKAHEECKNVCGMSALTLLKDFDIVEQTLPDMMHLVQGLLGRHFIPLCKGTRIKKKGTAAAGVAATAAARGADSEKPDVLHTSDKATLKATLTRWNQWSITRRGPKVASSGNKEQLVARIRALEVQYGVGAYAATASASASASASAAPTDPTAPGAQEERRTQLDGRTVTELKAKLLAL